MTLRTFSFGGGWQSTAALVLAVQGRIDFPVFLFANVGDDSENPATLAYVRNYAMPYAADNGIQLIELRRRTRGGQVETLWESLTKDSRSLPIPVRMANGAPGTRSCTHNFKVKVIAKWLKEHGATADDPAIVGIGISLDEIQRANTRRAAPHEVLTYPLIGLPAEYDTGLLVRRADCPAIIRSAGLPIPPKSACFFCPLHQVSAWRDMRREQPELFERAAQLEDTLNERRAMLGKDSVYLARYGKPLRETWREADAVLDLDLAGAGCDSGYCFT